MGTSAKRPAVRIKHEQVVVARMRGTQDRVADAITAFAGTMTFVYLHAAWFAVWIVCNEGAFGKGAVWDPYPFGLLTMIVSLEAIFLSTFVMVSQNRQAARENVRADLDFETNVRSEVWSVHMGRALGVDPVEVERRVQELLAENRARMNGTAQPPAGS
ncbi:DUF1003 domain-containing protein [Streptomyces griseorubiginosus]|uniref:DUF1003 domain-containing protein n=1 Tax=Streptomyces griseorubiginosus TaxID=67304 RepID=UPI001AD624B7|nr:DUF1003 domain-containing protein [Streptomyces griseorubiginosus]MBO4253758.1 DUF1003 domain-containing protein [Streptomyces griseorubiginosus]